MRYAQLDSGRIVQVFDDEYTAIPSGCTPLTEEQAQQLKDHPQGFSVFRLVGGKLSEDQDLVDTVSRGGDRSEVERLKAQIEALSAQVESLARAEQARAAKS